MLLMLGEANGLDFIDTDADFFVTIVHLLACQRQAFIMASRQSNNCILLLGETSDSFQLQIS